MKHRVFAVFLALGCALVSMCGRGGITQAQTTPQVTRAALSAINTCVTISGLTSQISGQVDAVGSGFTGTLTLQTSPDAQNWVTAANATPTSATLTATGQIKMAPASVYGIRACLTAYSAGSVTVSLWALPSATQLQYDASSGGTGPTKNVAIVAPTDAGGNVKVVMPAPSATQPVSGTVAISSLPPVAPATTFPVICATAVSFCGPTPSASPFATFSPYPGGAVVLTGPSTAPAASAGTYAVCVDSSGRLCVQTPAPVTQVSANIGTPTVVPSCPAASYPCGLPTPNATPVPCATAASGVCKFDIASQSLSPIVTAPQATIPAVTPTQSAQPAVSSLPVVNVTLLVNKTDGKAYVWNGCGTASTGTNTGCSANVLICNANGGQCAVPTAAPGDATVNGTTQQPVESFPMVFNGTTWDRQRKCTSTASGQTTSATTTALVAASGTTKVYICAYSFAFASGTAAGVKIIYGTKVTTDCDTGVVTMLNTTLLPATGALSSFNSLTMMETPASQEVCVVTTGSSTPTENWTIWYTQE